MVVTESGHSVLEKAVRLSRRHARLTAYLTD